MQSRSTFTILFFLVLSSWTLTAQCEWFKTGTTTQAGNDSRAVAVTSDGQGNVYVVGDYNNIFSIQGQDIANLYVNNPGVALCKFNSAGTLQWITNLSSPNFRAWDIAVRGGNIYISGNYVNFVTINGQNFSGQGENGLIIKFDGQGNMVWGKTINSPSSSYAYDIAFINDNSFLFTGRFRQSVIVDGMQINGSSGSKNYGLYGRMDTDGKLTWMKTSGESGNLVTPNALAIDPSNGSFYLGGVFRQGVSFGNQTAPSPGSSIANLPFVAKFNSSGDVQWLKAGSVPTGSTTLLSSVTGLSVAPNGNLILTGFLEDAVNFMGQTSYGESTALMMRIQSNGNLAGSLQVQGTFEGTAFNFSQFDAQGNLWLGGAAKGNLAVLEDGQPHSIGYTTMGYDILAAYYSATTGFSGIELLGGPGNEGWTNGAIDNANRLLATGYFSGTFTRNGVTATSPNGSTSDFLLMKICTFAPSSDIEDTDELAGQIHLTPNPAGDQTTLQVPNELIGSTCRILDIHGRVVYSAILPGATFDLPLHTLSNGMHLIQIQRDGSAWSKRLMIQK